MTGGLWRPAPLAGSLHDQPAFDAFALRPRPRARRARSRLPQRRPSLLLIAIALTQAAPVVAQESTVLDPVVVTATREARRGFDLPVAIDTIGRREIRQGEPTVNLSETLLRVPGIVALNRWNYAQDLQISSRGFGARATFGVRGIRLYQDDIPQTMPDGQGQTGSFQLFSTDRIEVLRGPFSTLYGNAAGGVIAVYTESGTPEPELTASVGGGSFGSWNVGGKLTGTARGIGYVVAATGFRTDGFREHSAAERNLGVAKLAVALDPRTQVTVLGTVQDQPESLDPLGLTRAQWEADPQQADPAAILFDTRKTVRQQQGGLRVDHAFSATQALRVTGYAGAREVRQYLAFPGTAPTSSGGVVDLDRDYAGGSAKWFQRASLAGNPLTLVLGVDYESQGERRQGFVNNNGDAGALRRDEIGTVSSTALYAHIEGALGPRWSYLLGLRGNEVRFASDDNYITVSNPDDSGSRRYRQTTPVAGIVFHATASLNVYVNYGRGFETPTFAELAYRPDGAGLNFDLQPATSQSAEIGFKTLHAGSHRLTGALFAIDTDDEIVINAATGGRTTYKNAGKTRRRGVELDYRAVLPDGLTAHAAYTYLDAFFASDVVAGSPPTIVPAGAKIPGVPAQTVFGELAWTPLGLPWLNLAAQIQYVARIYVNDRNSDAAPSYTIGNLRAAVEQRFGNWTMQAFARLDNFTDVNHVGSVIVGDTNGRYFEPAPGRNFFIGASASVRL